MDNTKKLISYCLDCIKHTGRASGFNNLLSNKDNKIIILNDNADNATDNGGGVYQFPADNKEIVQIMTKYALNKSTMSLLYGRLFLCGQISANEKYYSPLLFADAELIRQGDNIILECNEDELNINTGLISSLLENDEDIIENVISQLIEIENPAHIDFEKVLCGLIDFQRYRLEIKKQDALILAKTPESIAGLVNELRQIYELI